MVIFLERDADLHMAQLMPLLLTVSWFSKIQIGLRFWYWLTQVVLDKGPLSGCVSSSCNSFHIFPALRCLVNKAACVCVSASTLRHVCDRCGKGFVAAARLRRHISEMHDTGSQHRCLVCQATFANAGNLQRHSRLHSSVPRPYVCQLCQRSFTQKSSLQASVVK